MPLWFFGLWTLVGLFVAWRGITNKGFYVGGQKVDTSVVIAAGVVIFIAWGVLAAILLGLIQDHAP